MFDLDHAIHTRSSFLFGDFDYWLFDMVSELVFQIVFEFWRSRHRFNVYRLIGYRLTPQFCRDVSRIIHPNCWMKSLIRRPSNRLASIKFTTHNWTLLESSSCSCCMFLKQRTYPFVLILIQFNVCSFYNLIFHYYYFYIFHLFPNSHAIYFQTVSLWSTAAVVSSCDSRMIRCCCFSKNSILDSSVFSQCPRFSWTILIVPKVYFC